MDVDNIPVGINFEKYLNKQVAQCDAMLSVIGPNWLSAKDETDQRRLDKPDDFVAIELAAALARDILVIPVLVDGTHMPKAIELPASLKPLALRNAIQLRNTNFGSDAEQLIKKMREALALERPERTRGPEPLNASYTAAFLLNICVFLTALALFFSLSGNTAGVLAAFAAALPFALVGRRTLARDESVRRFGLVVCVGGLLAVAAIIVSGQFFGVGLFDSTVQSAIGLMGIMFLISALFFGQDKQWKADTETPKVVRGIINSVWFAGLVLPLGSMVMVIGTWIFLYQLTNSVAAALALAGVQLLVVGYCYVQYRKAVAAKSTQVPS